MDAKSVDRQAGSAAMAQEQRSCPAIGPGQLGSAEAARERLRGNSGAPPFLCAHGVQTRPSRFLPIGGNGLKPVCKRDGATLYYRSPQVRASEQRMDLKTLEKALSLGQRASE